MTWQNRGKIERRRKKTQAEVKIQRGIFQGNSLPLLLFITAMLPLNNILRKYTGIFKFTKSQKLLFTLCSYHKDICKKWKKLEILIQTIRIYSQDSGMEFSIENVPWL